MHKKTLDLKKYVNRTRLAKTFLSARRDSQLKSTPRATRGSNPSLCLATKKTAGQWSEVHDLQTSRRTSAHMLSPGLEEARTDSLERRDRRRTEADNAERE